MITVCFIYPYVLQPFTKSISLLQTKKQNLSSGQIATVEVQIATDPVAIYARQNFKPGDYAVYWSSFYLYQATEMKSSTRYFGGALGNYWGMRNTFASSQINDKFISDMKMHPPKIFVLNRQEYNADSVVLEYIDANLKIVPAISNGTYQAYISK